METLYVSDLDGTLLNKKKEITPKTAEILNRCIREGMKFSVATARMPYGCDYRLQDLAMTTPGILTNGVFLYDFNQQRYLDVQAMEPEVVKNALKIFRRFGISCFLYLYKKEQLAACCRKKAALRHRGVCIEGANSLENIREALDRLNRFLLSRGF